MRLFRQTVLAVILLGAPHAMAAEADEAGLARIRTALAAKLGQEALDKGFLKAELGNGTYDITITPDAMPGRDAAAVQTEASPIVLRFSPQADGRLTAPLPDAFSYGLTNRLTHESRTKVSGCKGSVTFDPDFGGLASLDYDCAANETTTKRPQYSLVGTGTGNEVRYSVAPSATPGVFESTLAINSGKLKLDIASGGAGKLAVDLSDYRRTTVASYTAQLSFADIVAATIRTPDGADGRPDAMRKAAIAMAPSIEQFDQSYSAKDIGVDTSLGHFSLGAASISLSTAWKGPEARTANLRVTYSGLQLPSYIPDTIRALVPTEGGIEIAGENIDLTGLAAAAIERYDPSLAGGWPPDTAQTFANILIAGKPQITLKPSNLAKDGVTLRMEGSMAFLPARSGRVIISADGYDTLQASIADSNASGRTGFIMALGYLNGLAKRGEDNRRLWDIEFDLDAGSFKINGTPLPFP